MAADLMEALLWNTLVSSFAILLVLSMRRLILNRFGARVAYPLWSIVPIVMIAAMLPASEHAGSMQSLVLGADAALPMPAVGAESGTIVQAIDPRPWLLLAWGTGCMLLATTMIIQQRRFVAALGTLVERDTGIHYAANASSSPALIGLFPARIVLPSDFDARYDRVERELIISHECIHRARGDHWLNALVAGFRCLFWFNPLVHAAVVVFRQDQELACDALVVAANPQSRRAYASAMLKAGLQATPLPVGCQWRSTHPLKERVLMLQKVEIAPARRRTGIAILAVMAASASLVAWAMQPTATMQRIEVELSFSGASMSEETAKRAILASGEILSVEVGRGERRKVLEIAFRSLPAGTIEAKGVIREGEKVVGTPEILFEDGKPASISMEEDKDGADRPAKLWKIDVTARAVGAAVSARSIDTATTGGGDAEVVAVLDSMPRYARISPPVYPADGGGARIQGTVYLNVRVGRNGLPLGIRREKVMPDSLAPAMADRMVAARLPRWPRGRSSPRNVMGKRWRPT